MKNFKKIMALIITAVMVLSMTSLAAFADPEPTHDRSISIEGLDKGDKVDFYKILEWADDSATADTYHAVQGWYWAEPFRTIFDKNGDMGSKKLYDAINDKNQLILTDALAGDIARAINGTTVEAAHTTVEPVNDDPVEAVNGKATYTFEGETVGSTDKDGLYMAIVTPADQDVVYNPVFIHLDSSTNDDSFKIIESSASYMNDPTGTGAAKKSRVTLDKEAHNSRDYTDSLDEEADPVDDGDTTKPGDVLTFTVTSTIPGYGATFEHPVFKLSDTMNCLKLLHGENDIFTVKVDGEEIEAGTDTYTLEATDDGYTITFAEKLLKGLHVPTALEVTYTAEVLEGANTNVIKEKNTVEVEFSHDPSTENDQTPGGERQYKKDITNHYTFSIDANNLVGPDKDRIGESGSEIIKIGVDKDGNPITSEKVYSNVTETAYQESPLEGAAFTLYGAKLVDGEIVIDTENIVGTTTSDASGRLNFTGLDAGTYFLQETKAPAGYVKNSDPVKVTIDATLAEQKITEWYDQAGNWYETEAEAQAAANANAELKNKKVTKYEYKTDELVSYTVTYGNVASTYTFGHVHESNGNVIKWSIATSSEAPQSIANVKGVELPSTGGIGTTLFYIIGAILVVGAGVVLITRRRMSAN